MKNWREEIKEMELEYFKNRVIKDAQWVKEQWLLGKNYFTHRVGSLQNADELAKKFNLDANELRNFVENEYCIKELK